MIRIEVLTKDLNRINISSKKFEIARFGNSPGAKEHGPPVRRLQANPDGGWGGPSHHADRRGGAAKSRYEKAPDHVDPLPDRGVPGSADGGVVVGILRSPDSRSRRGSGGTGVTSGWRRPELPDPKRRRGHADPQAEEILRHDLIESIDAIRTMLLRNASAENLRVVMVTSAGGRRRENHPGKQPGDEPGPRRPQNAVDGLRPAPPRRPSAFRASHAAGLQRSRPE